MAAARNRKATFKDVVLFLYLIVGAVGTTILVALQLGVADCLYRLFYFFVLAALIFNSLAWVPAAVLIVVYRRSWLVAIPAVTAIVSSITFFMTDDIADAPFTWTVVFLLVAFACGVIWLVKRIRGTDY